MWICFFSYFFFKREEGKERERETWMVACRIRPDQEGTRNLGRCPGWKWSPQPFGVLDDAPTNWATPARQRSKKLLRNMVELPHRIRDPAEARYMTYTVFPFFSVTRVSPSSLQQFERVWWKWTVRFFPLWTTGQGHGEFQQARCTVEKKVKVQGSKWVKGIQEVWDGGSGSVWSTRSLWLQIFYFGNWNYYIHFTGSVYKDTSWPEPVLAYTCLAEIIGKALHLLSKVFWIK